MKTNNAKSAVTVIVTENATKEQRDLADWLVSELARIAAETDEEDPVPDEGKPKTPLPEEEEPSSDQEPPSSIDDEDFWPTEPDEERECVKERTHGFLTGLVTAWLVTGAGVLILRLARTALRWLAELADIPFDVLVGLMILTALALLLRRKMRQFVIKIANWFDFDF